MEGGLGVADMREYIGKKETSQQYDIYNLPLGSAIGPDRGARREEGGKSLTHPGIILYKNEWHFNVLVPQFSVVPLAGSMISGNSVTYLFPCPQKHKPSGPFLFVHDFND